MTRGESDVTRPLLSTLVYLLFTLTVAAATCKFPDYLQSRDGDRRWRSHVTSGGDGTARCAWRDVSFVGDLWEIRVMSSGCPQAVTPTGAADSMLTSYRRRCVTSFNRRRFIVRRDAITVTDAATSTGNISRYDVPRIQYDGYVCVEFVRRSPTVIQLRESTPTWTTARFLETACNGGDGDITLTVDDWVLVDYGRAFFSSSESCPLADGGFSIRMFDKLSRRGICDAFNDETRVESRCSADEYDQIHFRFRYWECVPEGLGMDVDQPAYCLASWTDSDTGLFAYTLLRHHRDLRTWCLRYPAVAVSRQSTFASGQPRRSFTAYLFRDAFCDRSRTSLATARYLMIDFVPSLSHVGSDVNDSSSEGADGLIDGRQLCRDDYEACEFWRQPCRYAGSAMMLACSRRCGICSDDRPTACQLPRHIHGHWSSKLTPSHQQPDLPSLSDVIITQHIVQVNGANASIRLQCVTWDSLELVSVYQQTGVSSALERMFVRTFNNGCRPRYECIQFHLTAPGVLLYRRSRYRIWPFNGTTGIMVDCRSLFTYDEVWYQLLVSASGLHARCRLPVNVVEEELNVELKSGLRCRGIIHLGAPSEKGDTSSGFKLVLRGCPAGHESEQVYRCLDSSSQYDEHRQEVDLSVLVSADSAGGDLLCWWFGRSDPAQFLLLSAPACYDRRMAETIQPLAVFTRSVPASTSDAVSATTESTSRDELLSKLEVATDVMSGINNTPLYWHLFVAFLAVVYVSTSEFL